MLIKNKEEKLRKREEERKYEGEYGYSLMVIQLEEV
jgi:hypothetical protein